MASRRRRGISVAAPEVSAAKRRKASASTTANDTLGAAESSGSGMQRGKAAGFAQSAAATKLAAECGVCGTKAKVALGCSAPHVGTSCHAHGFWCSDVPTIGAPATMRKVRADNGCFGGRSTTIEHRPYNMCQVFGLAHDARAVGVISSRPAPKVAERWGFYEFSKPVGALCGDCKDTWQIEYQYFSEDELISQAAQNPSMLQCFRAATDTIKQRNILQLKLAEVSKDTTCGVKVTRRFKGFTKSAYESTFGVDPQATHHAPIEVPDELGDALKCYLVTDENAPRIVDIYHTVTQTHREMAQTGDTTLHCE